MATGLMLSRGCPNTKRLQYDLVAGVRGGGGIEGEGEVAALLSTMSKNNKIM